MVTKILTVNFVITRFIQEVCATRKGDPASHCRRWQDVNEQTNQPTKRPTNKNTRTSKHDGSQYLRLEVINMQMLLTVVIASFYDTARFNNNNDMTVYKLNRCIILSIMLHTRLFTDTPSYWPDLHILGRVPILSVPQARVGVPV